MLPPFIIEQIRRREEEERRKHGAPMVQLPMPDAHFPVEHKPEDPTDRGVIVVDVL